MRRHLLSAADLDLGDATLILDTAAQIDAALAGRCLLYTSDAADE